MQKKYSLDYSIERDVDRLQAVRDILDSLENDPNPTDLEQMASYILYGKDEEGKNAVQRKETTDSNKRYNSFQTASEKTQSLDNFLESPTADETIFEPFEKRYIYLKKKTEIRRPKYDKNGNLIDIGDGDIPFMQELWDRIDYIEKIVMANENKIPFTEDIPIIPTSYRLYQLKHQLIDMRRHQYYLKDSYKPTLRFLSIKPPHPQKINFDADSFYWVSQEEWEALLKKPTNSLRSKKIEDYETKMVDGALQIKWVVRHQFFDWENPTHIRALIENYSGILMQDWEDLHSWGRTLIFDFDRYVKLIKLSPAREYILLRKIDKAPYPDILAELKEKFNLVYNINHISTIIGREIPEKIANCAKRQRLLLETPLSERKQCFKCKKWLPRHNLFFGTNNFRKDGFASNCKECEKLKRIQKGGQSAIDKRSKDTSMCEVQAGKRN